MERKDIKGLLMLNLVVGVMILCAVLFGNKEESDPYEIQMISSASFEMGKQYGEKLQFMYLDTTNQLIDDAWIDPEMYEKFESKHKKIDY
jgi:hypothetical protein